MSDRTVLRQNVILSHVGLEISETSNQQDSGKLVTYQLDKSVGIITIDNPPVNALSNTVSVQLNECVQTAFDDPNCKAVVIVGAKGKFVGGADISGLQKMQHQPDNEAMYFLNGTNKTFNLIENGVKPTVAAISTFALGGGLELAMSCNARVCTTKTSLALPELKLGIIPGAGGTQRLPRLIGLPQAIDVMLNSSMLSSKQAMELGLVDEIVGDAELVPRACALALEIVSQRRPKRQSLHYSDKLPSAAEAEAIVNKARAETQKKTRGLGGEHPYLCLDAILYGIQHGGVAGLQKESECFLKLARSSTADALMHVFFSSKLTSKVPGVTDRKLKPRDIKKIAVVGAGLMGSGIATAALLKGISVILKDVTAQFLEAGVKRIKANLESRVKSKRLSQQQFEKCMSLLQPQTEFDNFNTVDMVIEAAVENVQLKQKIYADLEKLTKPDCILATNTSTIDIELVGEKTNAKDRIVGLHFFSPAHVMPLLEIVRSRYTSAEVLATSLAFSAKIGKTPVVVGNCVGFVVNRIFFPYGLAGQFLVERGISPYRIDKAIYKFGMPMGPFRMSDMAGIDIGVFAGGIMGKAYPDRAYPASLSGILMENKRLGEKTGSGYYKHTNRVASEDPAIEQIIQAARQKANNPPTLQLTDDEIVEFIFFPVVNEACRVIEEGMVIRGEDIDIATIMGMGFPAWRGGLIKWANSVRASYIHSKLKQWEDQFGLGMFKPAKFLQDCALSGKSLYSNPVHSVHRGGDDDIVITAALRTAIGKAGRGGFKDTPPDDLLVAVLNKLMETSRNVTHDQVGDIVVGTVLPPGDQAATEFRVASLLAGFPHTSSCKVVNRLCSSGLQSIADVASAIRAGYYDIGIAAGVESMSKNPFNFKMPQNPKALASNHSKDAYLAMGITSENVAKRYKVGREEQDLFALESNTKAVKAIKSGKFKDEIVPVTTTVVDPKTKESKVVTVDTDEGPRPTTLDNLKSLKPVFKKDGCSTAGNSSQLSDGAAAVLVMTRRKARELQQPVLGVLKSFAVAGVDPAVMGIGPAVAIPKALQMAGLSINDIDVFEVNEAFASQALYCAQQLDIPKHKLNPNGGAIALGHPLGCTGTRLTATLLHELKRSGKRYGVVSMCIGTGMGAAAVYENPDFAE